jgi:hypothetical protein
MLAITDLLLVTKVEICVCEGPFTSVYKLWDNGFNFITYLQMYFTVLQCDHIRWLCIMQQCYDSM